jgi:SAM-dependent methyltransferase
MRGIENIPWLYDAMLSFHEWLGLGRWRRVLVEGARGRTLDIGCGTGRNLPLYPSSVRVIALDPDPNALKRARKRSPGVPLVRGAAEQLPFRDGAFDSVVSGLVFCSVRDPPRGLARSGARAIRGPVSRHRPAILDLARRRLPSEPRHGTSRRRFRVFDRGPGSARTEEHAAILSPPEGDRGWTALKAAVAKPRVNLTQRPDFGPLSLPRRGSHRPP